MQILVVGGFKKMKKLLLLTMLLTSTICYSQTYTIPSKVVEKSVNRLNDYAPQPIAFQSFATQLTFTQLVPEGNKWVAGELFTVGESYLFSWGMGKENEDGSVTVEPRISLGAGINFGLTPSDSGVLVGSLIGGGIFQFSAYGLFGGYDILNERPVVGISYKLPGTILSGKTRFTKL